MKKIILILTVFLVLQNIHSQDWQIINPDYVYFYNEIYDTIITNTIKTDSVDNINGNPVYYLNQVIAPCDTCSFEAYYWHMPNFLQKKVEVFDDGRYWFSDTASYVLKTGEPGDTWIFDTTQNVSAQVISKTEEEIFDNINDSVLLIELSNTAQIKISKNYGITQFPVMDGYYPPISLVGIKTDTTEYGDKVPDFWDVFDFNVGDVFQYHRDVVFAPDWGWQTIKKTILSKMISGDTIEYYSDVIVRSYHPGNIEEYNETIQYINFPDHPANQYPNILYDMGDIISKKKNNSISPDFLTLFSLSNFDLSEEICLGNFKENNHNMLTPFSGNNDLLIYDEFYFAHELQFAPNLGKVVNNIGVFEYSDYTSLEGYVKDGNTTGIITPDGVLLGRIENKSHRKIQVFPNPVLKNENIHIIVPEYFSMSFQLKLLNIQGQQIIAKKFNSSKAEFKAPDNPGMYFIRIIPQGSDEILNQKLIVQ